MTARPAWHASRWKRIQAAAIAAVGAPLIAVLGRTYRWQVDGREHLERLDRSGEPCIFAFWHGRILPGLVFFRRRGIVVITSENFDGEWIARILVRFGYGTARGSTSRGAVKALVQLRREMAAGRATAFTVDGPRGPALVAQPGAVWLAKATGRPILPFHVEARQYWTAPSWDRAQVPKPFSRVVLSIGEPLHVAADVDEGGVEEARRHLEAVLFALAERARAIADPGPAAG